MDSNLIDLKKDVNDSGDDEAKVMLQPSGRLPIGEENLSAESHQDDNAHTEDYFSNDRKLAGPNDFDFEHIDPQAFMQRMSASAKEAQEQLDAKFAAESNDFNEFLGGATQDVGADLQYGSQSMTNMTRDFMNAERGLLGGGDKPQSKAVDDIAAPAVEKPAEVPEDDLLGGNGDGHYQPSAPPSAENADAFRGGNNFYDDMSDEEGVVTTSVLQKPSMADIVSTSTKDSDTDSASASYNPSPAKKRPVADTIKEQDNEKFISSEDLLSDYRDDRSGTPEFLSANSGSVGKMKPTDLDADDELLMPSAEANEQRNSKPTAQAAPVSAAARAAAYKNKYFRNKPGLISVEEVFYKYGLDAWFKPERLHPRVESLIYWRDVKKSGVVFGVGLVTLMAVSCFSVISVFAYLSLLALGGTISFKVYKSVMQAVQKTSNGHPFKEYLDMDLTLSQEKMQNFAGVAVAHVNGFTAELRRLFLVEDLIDSIKFGVILWVMTYIGAWFNGMTLVILAFVSLFTLPKVYENNKQSIDAYLDLVRSKLTEVTEKIKAAIPLGAKKPIGIETDKNK